MAQVEKAITISAPVERIFDYISVPINLLEIWPSIVQVRDMQRLANGGSSFRWVYKMGGIRFDGTSEDTEVVPRQRIVSKTRGGIQSTITWTFQLEDEGTQVTFEADYTVPIPLLGKLAEAFIVRANEREAELILANLKARMEA